MYKRQAFYTFFSRSSPTKALVCQGCIKSCIKEKQGPRQNPSPNRGSLFGLCTGRDIMLTTVVYDIQLKKRKSHWHITSDFFMFRSYKEQITLTLVVCSSCYLLYVCNKRKDVN